MKIRSIIVLSILICMLTAVSWNLYYLSIRTYDNANISSATKTMNVAYKRGEIYDCNFNKLVNRKQKTIAAAKPCTQSVDILREHISEPLYYKLIKCIGRGEVFCEETDEFENDDKFVKTTNIFERYEDVQPACHVIGYVNKIDNIGVSGIEKSFDDFLKEDNSTLKLRYTSDANNKMLIGDNIEFVDKNYHSKKGVKLTIDGDIQLICENSLKLYGIDKGACVVLDANTSEIKAMASAPTFNPNDIPSSLEDESSPFLNRALIEYSVGSVFKTVVAAAAITDGLSDYHYNCCGHTDISGKRFSCSFSKSHGFENLSQALANSCNTYFINLALQIGSKKLIDMARNLGFGEEIQLCDTINSDKGFLPKEEDIISDGILANLSFGQGSLMASPLQVAVCYGAIASDGDRKIPYIVSSFIDRYGAESSIERNPANIRAMTSETAQQVKELLAKNLESENYENARPSFKCFCGGKTSTAQTGWYDKDGKEIFHSWFAGFADVNEKTYVIVIFKENGKSGAADCAPAFREIVNRLIIYNRQSYY